MSAHWTNRLSDRIDGLARVVSPRWYAGRMRDKARAKLASEIGKCREQSPIITERLDTVGLISTSPHHGPTTSVRPTSGSGLFVAASSRVYLYAVL